MMGAHESSFWRDLFQTVQHQHDMVQTPLSKGTSNYNPNVPTHSREIQDLNAVIKEQQRKIELLETQLHDERLQHELHMQRSAYNYRIELEKLRKQRQNLESVIHQDIDGIPSHSELYQTNHSTVLNEPNHPHSDAYNRNNSIHYPNKSDFDDSIVTSNTNNSSTNNNNKSNTNKSRIVGENDTVLQRNSIDHDYHTIPSHNTNNTTNLGNAKRVPPPIPAFNFLKEQISANTSVLRNSWELKENNSNTNNTSSTTNRMNNIEIKDESSNCNHSIPYRRNSTNSIHSPSRKLNHSEMTTATTNSNNNNNNNSMMKSHELEEEEDFLKHIEKFQQEVRNLQASSPLSK